MIFLQLDCVLQIWGLACRADSFDRVVDRIHDEAFGQLHDRDFYMIHTIGLVTNLTVEMDMPVFNKTRLGVAPADFIFHRPASVLESVDGVMLQQDR